MYMTTPGRRIATHIAHRLIEDRSASIYISMSVNIQIERGPEVADGAGGWTKYLARDRPSASHTGSFIIPNWRSEFGACR
jgi:hypothetical protein